MLPEAELRRLAADIQKRGLINPILLYQGHVLDGRNRLAACQLAGVDPQFKAVDAELEERGVTALEYVVSLNLRRRQLNPGQQAMAAAAVLPEWTTLGKLTRKANLRGGRRPDGAKVRHRGRSDMQVGKLFGVSPRYVRLAEKLVKDNPDLAEKVQRGEMTLSRAVRLVRSAEQEKADAEKRLKNQRRKTTVKILRVDMRKSKLAGEQFNLILTDPPYSRNELPLYDHLGHLAGRTLVEGGFLAVLTGQQFLDQLLMVLTKPEHGLQYLWTVCLSFSGSHGRKPGLGIINAWRPFLIFVKPRHGKSKAPHYKTTQTLIDLVSTKLPALPTHKWEQLPKAFEPLVTSLSKPGDTVLDPFAGSGAVLEACRSTGRHAVGWDIDSKAVDQMEKRFR